MSERLTKEERERWRQIAKGEHGSWMPEDVITLLDNLDAADLDNTELRKTLQFYANEQHYKSIEGTYSPREVFVDRGERARAALEKS